MTLHEIYFTFFFFCFGKSFLQFLSYFFILGDCNCGQVLSKHCGYAIAHGCVVLQLNVNCNENFIAQNTEILGFGPIKYFLLK